MSSSVFIVSKRLFSSSNRLFSRVSVTSSGRRNGRLIKPLPPEEFLGLEPMEAEISHLWSLRALYSDSDVKNSLLNDNSFRGTCALIMKKLRYMRPEQIRSLAHLVLGINLPTNIGITKGALQMLRVHLHEYDARQLSHIYFLLKKNRHVARDPEDEMEPPNPNLEALLLAIPKALEIKIIGKQLSIKPDSLLLVLKSSTVCEIDIKAIRFLLQVIDNKLKYMNATQLNSLIGLLCAPHIEANLKSIGRPLISRILDHCSKEIVRSMVDQQFEIDYYFEETLKSLSRTNDPIYYNPKYCDTIYKVYEKSDSFENLDAFDDFLAFTIKYDHYSLIAFEKVTSLIASNPDVYMWSTPLTSANIIKILGHLNWRPDNVDWQTLFPLLLEDIKLVGSSFYSPIETLISFLILKEHEAFEHLAETESNSNIFSNHNQLESFYDNLITLNIGINCEANDSTPSTMTSILSKLVPEAINFVNLNRKPNDFQQSLTAFLSLAWGGKEKVISNVWTVHGHFIDNLLMIDNEGKPVRFTKFENNVKTGINFLSDYLIDQKNKLIAVLPLTDDQFNAKPFKLKGQFDLKFRTLEDFYGIKILRVHLDSWECLSDREKCSFLLRELSETSGKQLDEQLIDRVNCY